MAMGRTRTPSASVTPGGRQALESVMSATGRGSRPLPTMPHPSRTGGGVCEDPTRCDVPDPERFPVGELVARTGVPAATVHHYLKLGLLPPAHRAARNRFLYEH